MLVFSKVDRLLFSTSVQCPNKNEAQKSLATLAVSSFDIPGDSGFPLNSFMAKPGNRGESGEESLVKSACWLAGRDFKQSCGYEEQNFCLVKCKFSWFLFFRPNASVLHSDASGAGTEAC